VNGRAPSGAIFGMAPWWVVSSSRWLTGAVGELPLDLTRNDHGFMLAAGAVDDGDGLAAPAAVWGRRVWPRSLVSRRRMTTRRGGNAAGRRRPVSPAF
jgi:hypothetical protein